MGCVPNERRYNPCKAEAIEAPPHPRRGSARTKETLGSSRLKAMEVLRRTKGSLPPPLLWGLLAIQAAMLCVGAAFHAYWADEAQAWLLARDSRSLPSLLSNMRYEGHPPVWHLLIMPFAHASWNPQWMKLPHLLCAIGTAFLLFSARGLPVAVRILAPFSYFFLFEYGEVVRNYAPGILLLLLATRLLAEHTRSWPWLTPLLLALAALTSLPAAVTATSLFGVYVWRMLACPPGHREGARFSLAAVTPASTAASLCFVFAVAGCLLLVRPPADTGVFLRHHAALTLADKCLLAGIIIAKAYLPLLLLVPGFWNHTLWDVLNARDGALVGYVLFPAILLLCLRGWLPRAFLACTAAVLVLQLVLAELAYMRHVGWLFVALLIAMWIDGGLPTTQNQTGTAADRAKGPFRAARSVLPGSVLLGSVLATSFFAGIYAFSMGLTHPFSSAPQVEALLRSRHLDRATLVFEPDYIGSAILSDLQVASQYDLERQRRASFIFWTRADFLNQHLPTQAEWNSIRSQTGSAVLVTDKPVPPDRIQALRLQTLGAFSGSICGDHFYVYAPLSAASGV